jgi:hypothetical protein
MDTPKSKITWNPNGGMTWERDDHKDRRKSGRRDDDENISMVDHIITMSQEIASIENMAKKNAENHERFWSMFNDHMREEAEKMGYIHDALAAVTAQCPENHTEHHEWLKMQIRREEKTNELIQAVKEKVLTGGIWAVIVGSATLAWLGMKTYFGATK